MHWMWFYCFFFSLFFFAVHLSINAERFALRTMAFDSVDLLIATVDFRHRESSTTHNARHECRQCFGWKVKLSSRKSRKREKEEQSLWNFTGRTTQWPFPVEWQIELLCQCQSSLDARPEPMPARLVSTLCTWFDIRFMSFLIKTQKSKLRSNAAAVNLNWFLKVIIWTYRPLVPANFFQQ